MTEDTLPTVYRLDFTDQEMRILLGGWGVVCALLLHDKASFGLAAMMFERDAQKDWQANGEDNAVDSVTAKLQPIIEEFLAKKLAEKQEADTFPPFEEDDEPQDGSDWAAS